MIKCLESHSLAVSMIIMIAGLFFLVTPERQEPTPKWADYYIDELIQKGSNVLPIDVLSHPINTLDVSPLWTCALLESEVSGTWYRNL